MGCATEQTPITSLPKSPLSLASPPRSLYPPLVHLSSMGKDISSSLAEAVPGSATAPIAFPTRHNLARTFKYLMVLPFVSATQFLSRGIPFIFNSLIVRYLTVADYAVIFLILMQVLLFNLFLLLLFRLTWA
ncbi:hypothetical protein ZIOFF_019864 [Zingiber officinale]|uniref:Uncharacterized protein n=1 Tax=Zingiber officinale TaxID=94328 RepID=A0A8J5HIH2_ZINOF|nr:hypothetical protein ZIOFF_019864 [Zingiber officinale]